MQLRGGGAVSESAIVSRPVVIVLLPGHSLPDPSSMLPTPADFTVVGSDTQPFVAFQLVAVDSKANSSETDDYYYSYMWQAETLLAKIATFPSRVRVACHRVAWLSRACVAALLASVS